MLSSRWGLVVISGLIVVEAQQEDPNAAACRTLDYIVNACERRTPGWVSFTNFNFQAPCACYASSSWLPNGYDGWLQSCYAGYRTGNPVAYSQITSRAGGPPNPTPCQMAGNVLNLPQYTGAVTALVPAITPAPITNSGQLACASIYNAAQYCASVSPGFQTLTDFRVAASCYCYSGLIYAPSTFDGLWPSCVSFWSTSLPAQYNQASQNGAPVLTSSPCSAVGDVRDIRTTSQTVSSTSSSTSSSSSPTLTESTSSRGTTTSMRTGSSSTSEELTFRTTATATVRSNAAGTPSTLTATYVILTMTFICLWLSL